MWPGLSVKDIDEINKFMQVSSKTSMSNAIFHNLESGSNELQSGFSENQLKLFEKADTQHYLAKCRIQNLVVYNTLPESFACLFDPQWTFGNPLKAFSQKSRFFLVQWNFPLYTQGVLGCLLGFWPSGPKPFGAMNDLCKECRTIFYVLKWLYIIIVPIM